MDAALSGLNVVVGLGKTGLSLVRTLRRLGAEVQVTDSRIDPPGLTALHTEHPNVKAHLGGISHELCQQAQRLWLSPGVASNEPAVAAAMDRGIPVNSDIELFAWLVKGPVAAITGSNGKSTVTTLLGAMASQASLRVAVGGNLGTPALALLEEGPADLYVLELSSFQLETTHTLAPRVATVLNLSADHLDRYADMAAYAAAKQRIFRHANYQVINRDDSAVLAIAAKEKPSLSFGLDTPDQGEFGRCWQGAQCFLVRGDEVLLDVAQLAIPGSHNQANALAALAMGTVLNLPRKAMLTALQAFDGLAHRCQRVLSHDGVTWYNDSKGTNVGATLAAIHGLPGPLVMIAGGRGKGQDFGPLAAVTANKLRAWVLLGEATPAIAAVVTAHHVPVVQVASMAEAVSSAAELAQPGDQVLLSPACASLDMFANYQERGDVFAAAVAGLPRC